MNLRRGVPKILAPPWARRKGSQEAQIAAAKKRARRAARNQRNWASDRQTPVFTRSLLDLRKVVPVRKKGE